MIFCITEKALWLILLITIALLVIIGKLRKTLKRFDLFRSFPYILIITYFDMISSPVDLYRSLHQIS